MPAQRNTLWDVASIDLRAPALSTAVHLTDQITRMNFFKKLLGIPDPKDDVAESPEFLAMLDGSLEGLQFQTGMHQRTWNLGEEEKWGFSQETGELIFNFPDKTVRTAAQIIGTFDSQDGTWMWSWANPSIAEKLTVDADRIRRYGVKHRIRRLSEPRWSGNELDAWKMAALACRLCEANGAYRGPTGETYVFFLFGEIQISPKA
ncbi:hypothetical protein C5Y93_03300 [Blastopirellula marina]|uniref:Uncharacterized protein n=1 Tax=Blastopirellula marina TaxID=124 RepID=A0A2S8GTE4_9BACT|nr:hypothetical protein C5Y93_03300 [Blastopirellula marina]